MTNTTDQQQPQAGEIDGLAEYMRECDTLRREINQEMDRAVAAEDRVEELEATVARQAEQIERLRKALKKIADTEGNIHPSWHVKTAQDALAALEAGHD